MLADLDELTIRVRNHISRRNVEEAVRVLRAGSPRAAILLTWLAVVYDVIGKLRELEEAGDAQAKQLRAEFEAIRASGDIKSAQDFESRIPTIALSLELISKIEQQDLERLQKDRHRCAHPSQTDEDTAYAPTDELARSHLRTVVESMLQHPPAQGKAALARLQADIDSPYFPEDDAEALKRLKASPLHRARHTLIRNLAVTLVKAILSANPDDIAARRRRALVAMWQMHPNEMDEIAREKLVKLATDAEDSQLRRVLFLCRPLNRLWSALPEETRGRVRLFVENPPTAESLHVTTLAVGMADFNKVALKRLKLGSAEDLAWTVKRMGKQMPSDVARELISFYLDGCEDFGIKRKLSHFEPLAEFMNTDEIRQFMHFVAKDENIGVIEAATVVYRMRASLAEPVFRASPLAQKWTWDDISIPF